MSRAQVRVSSPSLGRRRTVCTVPLPKDELPTTTARPESCRAAATISAAEAEPPFISTTIGRPPVMSPRVASNSWKLLHHLAARQARGRDALDGDEAIVDHDPLVLGRAAGDDGGHAHLIGSVFERDAQALETFARRALLTRRLGRGVAGEAVERAGQPGEHG